MTADLDPVPNPALAPELRPEQIDASFVASRLVSAVSRRFDDEVLVVDSRNGRIHVLNSSAAIIWECLDGSASLEELACELADAFEIPADTMLSDVVSVVRGLGMQSLLEGVSPVSATPQLVTVGLEIGEQLAAFAAVTADGRPVMLPRPESTGTLLVNWSPFCGYCGAIADDLATMREPLEEAGVDLVFLTVGSPEDNSAMLGARGLADRALYRPSTGSPVGIDASAEGRGDPFGFMGTPVAYLLDGDGRLLAPLASGSHEVPRLARLAAGLPDEPVKPTNSLPSAAGVCGPSIGSSGPSRQWTATVGIAIGEESIGVRVDSDATESLLRRALGVHALPADVVAPPNFSVVLGVPGERGGRPARTLSLLLAGDRTVLRSRSTRRVLEALNARLSVLADPVDDSLLCTTNVAGVVAGKAILFPSITSRRLEMVQGRLARLGVALADVPEVVIDLASAELVVSQPSPWLASEVLAELPGVPTSPSELPPVAPGRYPLAVWILDQHTPTGAAEVSVSRAIAGVLPAVIIKTESSAKATERLAWAVDHLAKVFDSVRPVTLASEERERFAASLEEIVKQHVRPHTAGGIQL